MTRFSRFQILTCLVAGAFTATVAGAGEMDFYQDVYPFLKANCISCHNKTTTKAGLNMETPELMIEGGDSGPSIIPGNSKGSLLVEASIHTEDLEMPPKNNKTGAVNLTPKEIEILKLWIDQGAKSSVQQVRQVVFRPTAAKVHPIYAMAMSGDGRYVVCGRSNQIFVYDAATRVQAGQVLDGETAHRAMVHSLAFSPDGEWLASGSFREVKVWKRDQAPALLRKGDAALGLQIVKLTPNGQRIVGADSKGALQILEAATGKVVRTIPGVANVHRLRVSPESTKVAVFTKDWNLSAWNLADGKQIYSQTTPDAALETQHQAARDKHAAAVKSEAAAQELAATNADIDAVAAHKTAQAATLAAKQAMEAASVKVAQARKVMADALGWTRDGKAILTSGSDSIVRVWPLTPGQPALALKGAAGTLTALAAGSTPDEVISGGADNKVRVWSIAQAKVLREIPTPGILAFGVSPDGKQVASGGPDGVIRVWDPATAKPVADFRGSVSLTRKKEQLEWSLAEQGLEQTFQTKAADRMDAQTKALDELLQKAKDAIVAMTKKLPDLEKAIKPAQDARAAAEKALADAKTALASPPDGKPTPALENAVKKAQDALIASETALGSANAAFKAAQSNISDAEEQIQRITDTKTKNAENVAQTRALVEASKKKQADLNVELAAVKKSIASPTAKPSAIAFSADGRQVAASFDDGHLRAWGMESGIPVVEEKTGANQVALTFRADGAFVGCAPEGTLAASRPTPRWVLSRVLGGEKDAGLFVDRVNALSFSPDGKTLAAGGGEPSRSGDIALIETATGKITANWKEHHDDCVLSLCFSPDGTRLASGGADKITRVFEVATRKQVNLFEGHTHYVAGVAFRADGRVLATAGSDGVVNSWDLIQGERLKKILGWTKEVTSLQFIGATNQIVTAAGDNLIRIVTDEGTQVRSIAQLPDFMQAAASTSTGSTIIGGGEDGFLRFWNGSDGKELAAFGHQ